MDFIFKVRLILAGIALAFWAFIQLMPMAVAVVIAASPHDYAHSLIVDKETQTATIQDRTHVQYAVTYKTPVGFVFSVGEIGYVSKEVFDSVQIGDVVDVTKWRSPRRQN